MTPAPHPDRTRRIAMLDTAYLTQRYVRLREGLVASGTGLCSLTDHIDCDPVLLSPEARAFFVPNAILGLGFFVGAVVFLVAMRTNHPEARRTTALWLAIGLGIASLVTLRFFALLVRLPTLCPVCPWNHVLTYVGFVAALVLYQRARDEGERPSVAFLISLVAGAALPFVVFTSTWWALSGR